MILTHSSGTCPHDPPIRVLAMPASTMLFVIGCQLLLMDVLRIMKVPAPCRISSLPVGAPLRPGIYAYIEDICAVDGSGGTQFRQRLNLRYQASKHFREMLHRLTLFWAVGSIVCSAATTAIVFTIDRDIAYVVCTSPHFPHAHHNNISKRLAGYSPFSGLASGPPSPFRGCSTNSNLSTTTGPLQTSRLSDTHHFPLFFSPPFLSRYQIYPWISHVITARRESMGPVSWRRRFVFSLYKKSYRYVYYCSNAFILDTI